MTQTSPPRSPAAPPTGTTKLPLMFALGLAALALIVTATWAITWAITGDDDATAEPATTAQTDPDTAVVETVRATTESLYNFTPNTINATVKTAQATLCGDALTQWNETATTLPGIVADTSRSVSTSNAHYGVVRSDDTTTTVLTMFDLATTENNAPTPPPPAATAIEFTVQRTAVPMCISAMKVLP